jgi:hypothetical protein
MKKPRVKNYFFLQLFSLDFIVPKGEPIEELK